MQSLPDITQPGWFMIVTILMFLVVAGRYFVAAGLFYLLFYRWHPERWQQRKLNKRSWPAQQFRREIRWSCITALIFAITGTLTVILWQQGHTRVYTDVHAFPLWWLPVSLLIALVVHETYYYWLHRWMHQPAIFRIVHKVHHDSNITSPWTAFSFHPLEGVLQALFLPVVLLLMPMHVAVLVIQLTIMTVTSVINHLDIEIYPRNFHRHFLGRWLIGATHHSLHHKQFRYNFGLYFTFWDKWKQTESPLYEKLFEKATGTVTTTDTRTVVPVEKPIMPVAND